MPEKVYRHIPFFGMRPEGITPWYECPEHAFTQMRVSSIDDHVQVRCKKCLNFFSIEDDSRSKPRDWWQNRMRRVSETPIVEINEVRHPDGRLYSGDVGIQAGIMDMQPEGTGDEPESVRRKTH